MQEAWKPVAGFETLYEVSNTGHVRSLGNGDKRGSRFGVLVPSKGKYGHCRVQLCRDGTKRKALVHQLVAIAFISEPPPECEVNHIDYDPSNNHVENLQWVTHQENILHSLHRLRDSRGEAHPGAKLTDEKVIELRARYAQGGISFSKLGMEYGICAQQCQ